MTSHHEQRHQRTLSTSGDYEREAELTRRRLADHLDELSDRLTPGQVFDEMLSYSRAGGGTFFSAFSNAMRQNPLPSLLIGAGCMMFLSEKMGLRPGNGARPGNGRRPTMATADDPYGYAAAGGPHTAEMAARMSEASDRAPRASGRASDAAGRVSDAAERMTGAAASSARSAAASVQSGMSSAAEATSRQTSNAAGAVADTMRQAAATAGDTVAGATDAMRGTAHDLRDQGSAGAEQARRGAQNMAGAVRDTVAEARRRRWAAPSRTRLPR